jgi:hypothetical protein
MINLKKQNRNYVIRMGDGYWSKNVRWSFVPKAQATRLNHKEATEIAFTLSTAHAGTTFTIEKLK